MKKIKTSAPGKLMLFGEHSVVYGHPCIVTAVDQRLFITVEENGKNLFELDAPDLGLRAYSKNIANLANSDLPKEVRFIETCYKLFLDKYPQDKTIHVYSKSDFSSSFGFGSSSASTVAFAKAIAEFYAVHLTNDELFDLCYQTVLSVQGVGSGFDIAAAIWGGTLYYLTPQNKQSKTKIVEKITLDALPIMIGYTGIKADTATLVRMVEKIRNDNEDQVDEIFNQISSIVEQAKLALVDKDWLNLGQLMTANHHLLKEINVSSMMLESLIGVCINNGAYGAKLSGAGGGDCMLAITNADQSSITQIKKEIHGQGGEVLDIKLNACGVRLEEI